MSERDPNPTPVITAVAQDYLKVIWTATEWGGPPATVSSLAERMNTSRATVSATLGRLESLGLVLHERYGPIRLTATGTRHAVAMVRRHRLIETFLVERLGYGWDEVHDEAEQLEHAVTEVFVERISALLGDPVADPHGDPIPGPDGAVRYPAAAVPLAAARPGLHRIVRISDADPRRLRGLADRGVLPGRELRVGEPLDEELALAAASIIVLPIGD